MADDADFEQNTEIFLKWFKDVPGSFLDENVELADLRESGMGRAVVVRSNMKDKALFRVPRSILLTVTNSKLSKILPRDLESIEEGWLALTLVLMHEWRKGVSSRWAPYLNILPASLDALMFWKQEELQLLEGCDVLSRINKDEAEAKFKEQLLPIIQQNQHLFENKRPKLTVLNEDMETAFLPLAHLMASLVMAYSFDVERATPDNNHPTREPPGEVSESDDSEDVETIKAMVPMADMLNAEPGLTNARLFHSADGVLEMMVSENTAPGDQAYNTYGSMDRSEHLRCYGYMPNSAQEDGVEISEIHFRRALDQIAEYAVRLNPEHIHKIASQVAQNSPGIFDVMHPIFLSEYDAVEGFSAMDAQVERISAHSSIDSIGSETTLHHQSLTIGILLQRLSDYDVHNDLSSNPEAFVRFGSYPELPPGFSFSKETPRRERFARTLRIGEQRILLAQVLVFLSKLNLGDLYPFVIEKLRDIGSKLPCDADAEQWRKLLEGKKRPFQKTDELTQEQTSPPGGNKRTRT